MSARTPDRRDDPVHAMLRDRGAAQHVVRGGLTGLVRAWEHAAASVARGYDGDLDDYLNDLDGRQLLADALAIAPASGRDKHRTRIEAADALFRAHVELGTACLWGADNARKNGWSAEKNWWYHARPKAPGDALRDDLARR